MEIASAPCAPRTWDIFCKVIDNYGDIGVCWRLCQQLVARGQSVRLIVDDARALAWMAVQTEPVEVMAWDQADLIEHPANAVIESFGCELPESYIAKISLKANNGVASHWINLEYLSAEPYAERNHLLPSPVMSGAGRGLVKTFFYPGFTSKTGGLLREPYLFVQQAAFDKTDWLAAQGISWNKKRIISLFCYEPKALPALLAELQSSDQQTLLLVTAGRASNAVQVAVRAEPSLAQSASKLCIHYLPYLSQLDYDHLLWTCDFNFVRGEDSLLRAIWAGKPFVWQVYAQDDNAHHEKLNAFLDVHLAGFDATTSAHIRQAHYSWNEMTAIAPTSLLGIESPAWQAVSLARRRMWAELPDLLSQLLEFVNLNNHPDSPYSQTELNS